MAKSETHDLVVIGAGPGGYTAAIRAAQLGLKVACVEKEPALGGTCLRVGCIPSKALLESSERWEQARENFKGHGISFNDLNLDLAAMLKRKDQIVGVLTKGIESLFKKNRIVRYHGSARLESPGSIRVDNQQGSLEVKAGHVIIATGSKPAMLPGIQLTPGVIGTSTDALAYPHPPNHLVVIGGGYIGLELGSVWRRLGARVTVLEFLDRILAGLDSDIADEAAKIFAKQGLNFRLGARVTSARIKDGSCRVEYEGGEPIVCDRVLVAVGRIPNTDGLGLDQLPLALHKKGFIPVNEKFATTVPGLYAIGDVIPGPMLAHKAEEEGIACVEGIVGGHGHVNYDAIAAVVYTEPEIGAVGKTEDELKAQGIQYRKGVFPFRANARARTLAQVDGFVKVLADAATDRILGVHIIGAHAGDLINEAATAISFGASAEDLARTCHAHPTLGEALREAALAADNRAINM